MSALRHVPIGGMDPRRVESVLSAEHYADFLALIASARRRRRGRVIWNVNSTAKGGGVV